MQKWEKSAKVAKEPYFRATAAAVSNSLEVGREPRLEINHRWGNGRLLVVRQVQVSTSATRDER